MCPLDKGAVWIKEFNDNEFSSIVAERVRFSSSVSECEVGCSCQRGIGKGSAMAQYTCEYAPERKCISHLFCHFSNLSARSASPLFVAK